MNSLKIGFTNNIIHVGLINYKTLSFRLYLLKQNNNNMWTSHRDVSRNLKKFKM